MSSESYYDALGLPTSATLSDIQEAFAALITNFPEASSKVSNPAYEKLLQAYEVLSDKNRREIYDSLLVETAAPSLTLTVQCSRQKMKLTDTAQAIYFLLEVNPPTHATRARRPINLCLALDRSTSMQGERLNCVKTAVELIIDKLAPEDVISIVSYSDRAEVVTSPTRIQNKNVIISHIRDIQASGGTEIYQGLLTSIEQMRQMPLQNYINHLILLTDGHTYGDANQCIQLAQKASQWNIGLSAFGIGSEWNDQFLDQLVAPSGGRSAYIEEPTQIIDYLQERIKGLGVIHGRNLRLKKSFPEKVTLQYGFKLLPFAQPLELEGSEIKLGNLEGKGSLSILLELLIHPQEHESKITIPFEITAEITEQNNQQQKLTAQIQIILSSNAPAIEPPQDIVKAVRMLNMYRMNEKVWEDLEAGHVGAAATRLRRLTTRLLEAGEIQLAQQANAETERLSNIGELSEEGRKRLKFGTRTMIGQTMKIEDTYDPL
ncbi:MAG: VWA domain-containing protein [Chloroflexota bacterium]